MTRLGYPCINTVLRKNNIFCARTCRKANFSVEKVQQLALQNCLDLNTILQWNVDNRVDFMRVSSNLFPFYDDLDLGWSLPREVIMALQECQFYTNSGYRLTTHPGPYTVLSSENPEVRLKAYRTMTMHYLIGYDLYYDVYPRKRDYCINIHVGRSFSERAAEIFCHTIREMDSAIVDQITIENDDKPNGWTVQNLKKYISDEVGIPIVFDYHHHRFCNEGETPEEALEIALSTWPDHRRPKVHYSESRPGNRPQAHSDLVKSIPSCFEGLDVMVEAKKKEQAIMPFIQNA